jgi:hypothetical protein
LHYSGKKKQLTRPEEDIVFAFDPSLERGLTAA